MTGPAITVTGLTKTFVLPHEKRETLREWVASGFRKMSYDRLHALRGVSFEVPRGACFGIIGRNGSGKSTLLKILAGIFPPTAGSVSVRGMISPFLELGVGFNPDLSARDNVYLNAAVLGMRTREIDAAFDEIIAFAELERFVDQKLKNFSSGMQVRLAFSVAIRAPADVYLMDEVLAVGDLAFQQKCFEVFRRFRDQGKTIVLVSHDLASIANFCTRTLYLKDGEVMALGPTADVLDSYVYEDRPADTGATAPEAGAEGRGGPVRIVAARVLDRSFVPRRRVVSGHPMSIELQYEVDPAVAGDAVLEMSLSNDQGTVLFAADSVALGAPPAPAGTLVFSFASLALGGGYVAVKVSARRRDGTPLLARQRIAELDVIVGAATGGVVYMPVKARFDTLPPVTLAPAPPAQ